jgi:hypothetical protein
MKPNLLLTLFTLLIMILVACPSTPPVKVDLPEQEYNNAKKLKTRVTTFGFDSYAPEEFALAEQKYKAGEDSYNKDNAASKTAFVEAIDNYKKVMKKGIAARMKDRQGEIDDAAKMADDIKANVATPEEYNKAKEAYTKGVAAANDDNWEEAEPLLNNAKTLYNEAYTKSKDKKDKAEKAMESSKQAIEDAKARNEEINKENTEQNTNESPTPEPNGQ